MPLWPRRWPHHPLSGDHEEVDDPPDSDQAPATEGGKKPLPPCELCGPPIDLARGERLTIRHSHEGDADGLRRLYERLSPTDTRRRFFTGGRPPPHFYEHWAAIESEGGFGLVVEITGDEPGRLVAEAGYGLVAHGGGDGEVGIAIDPDYRGWLGPWLFDRLLAHAHQRGVANMQALVMVENRVMLALAAKRGYAILGHPDWDTIRITMATAGSVPGWSGEHERPRVLIETDRTRWMGEDALDRAGFDIAICAGACRSGTVCPIFRGEPCPLLEGADAVIIDLPDADMVRDLLHREQLIHPAVRKIAATDPDQIDHRRLDVKQILEELDDLRPADQDDDQPSD